MSGRILVLGAGPTGLGAAYQLNTLGQENWLLMEASPHPGGLSSTFVDDKGFYWDIGGHVQFSHYEYFDNAMQRFLGADGWLRHERESWIWMRDRFIPYPLQNNVHRLPKAELLKCLLGLLDASKLQDRKCENFQDWIDGMFGAGLAEIFMNPYNEKVWAYPPNVLNSQWVGERVSKTDIRRVLTNLVYDENDVAWGPNSTFLYPKHGGTGAIWTSCCKLLPQDKVHLNKHVVRVDVGAHKVFTADGSVYDYDHLITTIPLTRLVQITGAVEHESAAREGLLHSSTNIVGLGIAGRPRDELKTKCWMYFPEDNSPFYRVTVFSNYSPYNVPDSNRYWSLMCEVSESGFRQVDGGTLVEKVIQGALNTKLIDANDQIVSTWTYRTEYGYPTPGVHRDSALNTLVPYYESREIYTRGRFGLWKYEVSNQDHSFMQGVEVVERLLHGRREITAFDPDYVNARKHKWPYDVWET